MHHLTAGTTGMRMGGSADELTAHPLARPARATASGESRLQQPLLRAVHINIEVNRDGR